MSVLESAINIFNEIKAQIKSKSSVWGSRDSEFGRKNLSERLIKALKEDNKKEAKGLIRRLPDLKNVFDKDGAGPLHHLARSGDLDTALDLLERGVDLEKSDIYGWKPLHAAVFWGRKELVAALLDRGADIRSVDNNGLSPLHLAAQIGDCKVAKVLLERQRDQEINIIDSVDRYSMTPLHIAAFCAREQVVELLVNCGAKVNTVSINGDAPIEDAERGSNQVITKLLKQALNKEINSDLQQSHPKLGINQPQARKLDVDPHDKSSDRNF